MRVNMVIGNVPSLRARISAAALINFLSQKNCKGSPANVCFKKTKRNSMIGKLLFKGKTNSG